MNGVPLRVKFSALWRATLDERGGNVGFIGLSGDGLEYHVVVPVDLQIARGVKACNAPADGTPFGGYAGWRYFQCEPFAGVGRSETDRQSRQAKATENGKAFRVWAVTMGIAIEIEGEAP
jgi:hypothetical protein